MDNADKPHGKKHEILVNTKPKSWESDTISYSQVVNLAFPSEGGNSIFTVQYSHGVDNAKGTLVDGQTIQVKGGMRFDVARTDKS